MHDRVFVNGTLVGSEICEFFAVERKPVSISLIELLRINPVRTTVESVLIPVVAQTLLFTRLRVRDVEIVALHVCELSVVGGVGTVPELAPRHTSHQPIGIRLLLYFRALQRTQVVGGDVVVEMAPVYIEGHGGAVVHEREAAKRQTSRLLAGQRRILAQYRGSGFFVKYWRRFTGTRGHLEEPRSTPGRSVEIALSTRQPQHLRVACCGCKAFPTHQVVEFAATGLCRSWLLQDHR